MEIGLSISLITKVELPIGLFISLIAKMEIPGHTAWEKEKKSRNEPSKGMNFISQTFLSQIPSDKRLCPKGARHT